MDLQEIKLQLLGGLEELLPFLLPAGKRAGNYFEAGSAAGEAGKSLRVCLSGSKRGVWMDGASDGSGDIIDLWCAVRGVHKAKEVLPEIREYLNIPDHQPVKSVKVYKKPPADCLEEMDDTPAMEYLYTQRGISPKVKMAFKVGETADGNAIAFPYYDVDGEMVMVKYTSLKRDDRGKKKVWATPDPKPVLFGLQTKLVRDANRSIVITEGEIDAMSYQEQGIAAVSVPFGAKADSSDGTSANDEWIDNCFDWLSQFDTIYLSMDMDQQGEDAGKSIMRRLGRERCRMVKLPFNDANEVLCNGDELELYVETARTSDPDDMALAADKAKSVWEVLRGGPRAKKGIVPFDWPESECPWRLRPREGTIVTGFGGHGKSNFTYQLTAWLAGRGDKVFIGSYEEPADEILAIMATHANAKEFDRDEYQDFKEVSDDLYENIHIHDYEGQVPMEKFFEYAEYAVKRYGCAYVILDSLTTTDVELDDKDSVAKFAKRSQAFWKRTGCHLIVICHPRKGYDEKNPPLKQDVKGGGHLGDLFFNVITLHRPDPEDPRFKEKSCPDGELWCSKQKVGGIKFCMPFSFDDESYRIYLDMEDHHHRYVKTNEPF